MPTPPSATALARSDAAAERLNALILPTARARIETMGSDAAGAYGFYQVRVDRGDMFAHYERVLSARLIEDPACPPAIHEVGGGYGSLSMLMGALGREAVCLEVDIRRFDGGCALLDATRGDWPAIADRVRFVYDRFPSASVEPDGAWAVITNLVATATPVQRAAIVAALGRYPTAIIDIDRFLEPARTEEARAAVLDEFRQSGLEAEPYLDLGDEARYYRLTRMSDVAG